MATQAHITPISGLELNFISMQEEKVVRYERKYPLKTLKVQNCSKRGRGQRTL